MVFGSVAVIALVIGALLGAFVLGGGSMKASVPVAVNPAGSPAAEVSLASEDNPGPVRMDGLVPSGFTTGPTGAVAAAVAYSQAAVQLSNQPAATVEAAARKMTASGKNPDVAVTQVANGLRTTLRAKPDTTHRVVPLGRKLGTAAGARQSVDVWIAVITATPGGMPVGGTVIPAPTEVTFLTVSTGLVYTGNDWKIESLAVSEGPTPALGENAPVESTEFAKSMRSFLPYGYLPPVEVTK